MNELRVRLARVEAPENKGGAKLESKTIVSAMKKAPAVHSGAEGQMGKRDVGGHTSGQSTIFGRAELGAGIGSALGGVSDAHGTGGLGVKGTGAGGGALSGYGGIGTATSGSGSVSAARSSGLLGVIGTRGRGGNGLAALESRAWEPAVGR